MAEYRTDLTDLNYVLFDWLKVQDHIQDFEANDLKDIINAFEKVTTVMRKSPDKFKNIIT